VNHFARPMAADPDRRGGKEDVRRSRHRAHSLNEPRGGFRTAFDNPSTLVQRPQADASRSEVGAESSTDTAHADASFLDAESGADADVDARFAEAPGASYTSARFH